MVVRGIHARVDRTLWTLLDITVPAGSRRCRLSSLLRLAIGRLYIVFWSEGSGAVIQTTVVVQTRSFEHEKPRCHPAPGTLRNAGGKRYRGTVSCSVQRTTYGIQRSSVVPCIIEHATSCTVQPNISHGMEIGRCSPSQMYTGGAPAARQKHTRVSHSRVALGRHPLPLDRSHDAHAHSESIRTALRRPWL